MKRDQGEWVGRLEKITRPSTDRVEAPRPHAGVCGGCLWQQIDYAAQLRLKREMINRTLAKAGHVEQVDDVVPSPDTLYYRNRMDYVVGWTGGVGLKEYGTWNRYVDVKTCLLLDKEASQILEIVRTWMRENELQPWDAKKQTGLIRYCVIRLGKNTNERMVTLIVKDLNGLDGRARQTFSERIGSLATSLLLGENPEITDLSLAKTIVVLRGPAFLTEEVNGIKYHIHPNSFFQTNTRMAASLQDEVLACAGELKGKRLLDLYCGLGFFGIAVAKRGASIYGHELDAQAIELAKENAALNGVDERARFGAGPVEGLDWKEEKPDIVIVDPPRAGLHPKALAMLIERKSPVIIYVSCSYHRLAEELKALKGTYRVDKMTALDLFPHTPHVELVTRLVLS